MNRTLTILLTLAVLVSCTQTSATFAPTAPSTRLASSVKPPSPPVVGGCQIFPANNWWNTDISNYPLDPLSSQYIACAAGEFTPGFRSGSALRHSVQYRAGLRRPKVPVHFRLQLAEQSGTVSDSAQRADRRRPARNRRPARARVAARGVQALRNVGCVSDTIGGKSWSAGSGALFHLNSNKLRPNGWTSADAAGLPITSGAREMRRSQGRRDRSRTARDVQRNASGVHSSRDALRERAAVPRICRRWVYGFE